MEHLSRLTVAWQYWQAEVEEGERGKKEVNERERVKRWREGGKEGREEGRRDIERNKEGKKLENQN